MRKTVPIIVLGGAALLIASQFLKLNIGWRDSKTPLKEQVEEKVEKAAEAIKVSGEKLADSINPKPEKDEYPENAYVGMPLADVLIDGDKYLLLTHEHKDTSGPGPAEHRKEVALYEVLRLARELPGDSTGIKVRIWRTPTATAEAESALKASLSGADISADQIDYRNRLVEP
jgi:hypothetical protein